MIKKSRALDIENSQEVVSTKYGRKPSSIRKHQSNTSLTKVPNMIHFGSSIISVQRPNEASTKRNIKAGQKALSRAMLKITKPGIVIKPKKGVPLYYADPEQKGIIIRKHNRTLEKGIFKNGKFTKCR